MGIPQGSVLSGLLCNYFFGHIERCLLGDVLETRPLSTSRPPANAAATRAATAGATAGAGAGAVQAATTAGSRCGAGGGGGEDGGVRGQALGWDRGATGASSSSSSCGSCRPDEGFSRVRSAEGRKRARLAVEGLEEEGGGREKGGNEDDAAADGDWAGDRRAGATGNPSHRSRAAETGRGESQGRAGAGAPSAGGGGNDDGVFPDPEGDCTLLRQVDDFLLVSTGERSPRTVVCHVPRPCPGLSTSSSVPSLCKCDSARVLPKSSGVCLSCSLCCLLGAF